MFLILSRDFTHPHKVKSPLSQISFKSSGVNCNSAIVRLATVSLGRVGRACPAFLYRHRSTFLDVCGALPLSRASPLLTRGRVTGSPVPVQLVNHACQGLLFTCIDLRVVQSFIRQSRLLPEPFQFLSSRRRQTADGLI